jgi:hypothetical protein
VSHAGRRRAATAALLLAALALVAGSQAVLASRDAGDESGRRLLYLPNGRYLKVAALGYPTFLADLIYLWSIQHYGGYGEREERFRYLEHVYGEVIARLDPRFVDPYLVGALILVVEKQDVAAALDLLDQGIAANPDDWLLPYEAGFWAYDTAHDYPRAAAYFARAREIPGAPPSVRRLHAEMLNKQGDKATSLALWTEVLEQADQDRVRAVAANHVHDLTLELDLERLQRRVEEFSARRGRPPRDVAELVTAGLLAEVPLDPDGNPYALDPATGDVSSTTPFRLRRR